MVPQPAEQPDRRPLIPQHKKRRRDVKCNVDTSCTRCHSTQPERAANDISQKNKEGGIRISENRSGKIQESAMPIKAISSDVPMPQVRLSIPTEGRTQPDDWQAPACQKGKKLASTTPGSTNFRPPTHLQIPLLARRIDDLDPTRYFGRVERLKGLALSRTALGSGTGGWKTGGRQEVTRKLPHGCFVIRWFSDASEESRPSDDFMRRNQLRCAIAEVQQPSALAGRRSFFAALRGRH
jgi:hypothetical protein